MNVDFEILGTPAPQGSKTGFNQGGRVVIVEGKGPGRAKHKAWRQDVAATSRDIAADVGMFDGPLRVHLEFRLSMRTTAPKWLQDIGWDWAPTKPDIDKLVRSTLDGLVEGGLIREDSRVVELSASKIAVVGWTGCQVHIETLTMAQRVTRREVA